MGLLTRAYNNLKAPAVERLPEVAMSGSILGGFGPGQLTGQLNQLNLLSTYATIGWLFSTISRIAEGVAAAEWRLYRNTSQGDRTEIFKHPVLDLWNNISPHETRQSLIEASEQHFELVGEMWWVINRFGNGVPAGLQLVRPDRMRPLPSRENFLHGYMYTIGSERVILEPEDVILIKRPSPLSPYRGIGVVQSILVDMGAEQMAAQWNRNFFSNSAEPGGIIELDTTLSEPDFERLRAQWNAQHRGVANAHRVALLERGQWKTTAFTQRNMQFKDLRGLNRDIILEAFGLPRALLGISEQVNLANALVAETTFSRWLIKPRLERIKGAINHDLVHPYFGEDLELDYDDPTPVDREFALREATEGYGGKILTLNEARARLGEGEVDGGDEFSAPAASPFALGGVPPMLEGVPHPRYVLSDLKTNQDALDHAQWITQRAIEGQSSRLDQAEAAMVANWAVRLAAEASALAAYFQSFDKNYFPFTKIEVSDIEGYDWDWWSKYGEDTVGELLESFEASILDANPDMDLFSAQRFAATYAEKRGADLLRIDGDLNLANITRARVRSLVAGTIERGDSLNALTKSLREDFAFSPDRARVVARTETATALGQGAKQAAVVAGQEEKRWITQGDDRVDAIHCLTNEAQGFISINEVFQSGHETVPAHPNCRCTVLYQRLPADDIDAAEGLEEDVATAVEESRSCPRCHKNTLVVNKDGPGFWCRRCKQPVKVKVLATASHTRFVVERDTQGRIAWIDDIEVAE